MSADPKLSAQGDSNVDFDREGVVQMEFVKGSLHGDLEAAFSKIAEGCSCFDQCQRLLDGEPNRPGYDQHRGEVSMRFNMIKEHASNIQMTLIDMSDEAMHRARCSPASTRGQPSAFERGASHSVELAASDESRPAHQVIRSTDPEWSYEEMMAQQIRWWSERRPNSSFCPITIGQDMALDQRQRHLLWNCEDVDSAFGNPGFALEMFGLRDADQELDSAVQAALECIGELHQWGRVTAHGMAVGAVRAFIESYPLFERHLDRSKAQLRSPDKIRNEIEVRVRALQALCAELGEARNEEVRRKD